MKHLYDRVELREYNPHHDKRGRFSSSDGSSVYVPKPGGKGFKLDRSSESIGPKPTSGSTKPYASSKDASDALKKVWPNVDAKINFEGLPADVASEFSHTLQGLGRDYPEVARQISYIGTKAVKENQRKKAWDEVGDMDQTTSAQFYAGYIKKTNSYIYSISINPLENRSLTRARTDYNADIDRGWHPSGMTGPAAHITHEFGHVFGFLGGGTSQRRAGIHEWNEKHNMIDNPVKSFVPRIFKAKNPVSKYASQSAAEALAETFLAARAGGKNLQHPVVKDFVDMVLSK